MENSIVVLPLSQMLRDLKVALLLRYFKMLSNSGSFFVFEVTQVMYVLQCVTDIWIKP